MIKSVTVTIVVPADRLTDLQAFCQEIAVGTAPTLSEAPAVEQPAAEEPAPKKTRKPRVKKSADTKEARQAEAGDVVTLEMVRNLLGKSVVAKKQQEALQVLHNHGAKMLPELTEDKFAAVAADLQALING